MHGCNFKTSDLIPYIEATNFGGRFHDSFAETEKNDNNKNLFTENFGEGEILARARLREFVMIDERPLIPGTVASDPRGLNGNTPWPYYRSEDYGVHERQANTETEIIGRNISWQLGDYSDERKVFMPTFNHAQFAVESAGNFSEGVPELFQQDEAFRMTEATGSAVDSGTVGLILGT